MKLDRGSTRELARRVRECADAAAALALFEHSVACGHTKIALLRYLDARRLRAPLCPWHLSYVESVSTRMGEKQLHALVAQSWRRHDQSQRRTERYD